MQPLLNGPDSAAAYGQRYARVHRSAALSLIGAVAYTNVLSARTTCATGSATLTPLPSGAGFHIASTPFRGRLSGVCRRLCGG
jgi:hypothetical protein